MRAKRKPYNIKPMQPGGRPCRACVILRTLSGGCVQVSFPMNGESEITARPLRGLLYMFICFMSGYTFSLLLDYEREDDFFAYIIMIRI